MSGKRRSGEWRVFGCSVQGANHQRLGLPNQDAIDWLAAYGGAQPYVALAVADGHGSARYVRSDVGAQLAVAVARTLLCDLAGEFYQRHDLGAIKQMATHRLPGLLARCWRQRVAAHLSALPLTTAELAPLNEAEQASLARYPHHAYGSTLVATLATESFLLYVQLGDGDIVTVDDGGAAARPPLASDARLLGDATTSLCMDEAQRAVRIYFQPLAAQPPALVMLATDGYANSFAGEADFLLAAHDIQALVQPQCDSALHALRNQLPGWLRATSDQGSGDDITVGILLRTS